LRRGHKQAERENSAGNPERRVAGREGAMSKPRGRPFPPGNTAGQGRPPGSRNNAKSPALQLLDDYALPLTRKCLSLALTEGDRSALRMCMDRISAVRRVDSIRLSLPRIKTVQDVNKAMEKVTQAVGRGKITPVEGETMTNILVSRAEVIEKVDMESRLEKLEKLVSPIKLPRAA
jgi:hypothetical protein